MAGLDPRHVNHGEADEGNAGYRNAGDESKRAASTQHDVVPDKMQRI